MKNTKLLQYMVAVCAGLIFWGGAQADEWKVTGEFGWFGVGKAQEIEKSHFYWVGEFTASDSLTPPH